MREIKSAEFSDWDSWFMVAAVVHVLRLFHKYAEVGQDTNSYDAYASVSEISDY